MSKFCLLLFATRMHMVGYPKHSQWALDLKPCASKYGPTQTRQTMRAEVAGQPNQYWSRNRKWRKVWASKSKHWPFQSSCSLAKVIQSTLSAPRMRQAMAWSKAESGTEKKTKTVALRVFWRSKKTHLNDGPFCFSRDDNVVKLMTIIWNRRWVCIIRYKSAPARALLSHITTPSYATGTKH